MALDFPNSPVVGQVFSSGSRQWVWTGNTWDSPAAGTPGIVSSTGGTFTGDITAPNYAGRGNAIINGAFDIWQRGTSGNLSGSTPLYLADRFFVQANGTGGTITVSQQPLATEYAALPDAGVFFHRVACTSARSGTTFAGIYHRIESVRTFAGETVTLSFYAKADSSRTVPVGLEQNFGSGGSASVFGMTASFAVTSSWQRFTATFTVPSIAGKTFGLGNFLGLNIDLPRNTTSTIDIWGVQLEAGTIATPFRRNANSLQGELAACQRYYQRFTNNVASLDVFPFGSARSTTAADFRTVALTQMRTTPTSIDFPANMRLFDGTNAAVNITSLTLSPNAGPQVLGFGCGVASGLTAFRPYLVISENATSGFIGFSAEL
jgi:hypothetical protein